ncbi:MAG TPA: CoA transferase, partial [Woeseiaceae bacterium]|nr:CoA transferase [Woeseiaceae bacterium]
TEILDAALSTADTSEWLGRLQGSIPCAPVHDVRTALENRYFVERHGVEVVDHQRRSDLKFVANPIRLDERTRVRPGPGLGQDSQTILEELGYSAAEISRLKSSSAI